MLSFITELHLQQPDLLLVAYALLVVLASHYLAVLPLPVDNFLEDGQLLVVVSLDVLHLFLEVVQLWVVQQLLVQVVDLGRQLPYLFYVADILATELADLVLHLIRPVGVRVVLGLFQLVVLLLLGYVH